MGSASSPLLGRAAASSSEGCSPAWLVAVLGALILLLYVKPPAGRALSQPRVQGRGEVALGRPRDIFAGREGPPPPPARAVGRVQAHQSSVSPPWRERRPPPAGCDECSLETLVEHYSLANTLIVSFGNARQRHFTANWVYHLQALNVHAGILVGMMNMRPTDALYRPFAASLRARGVGVYCVNSAEVKLAPQGGRWFHVLPLLRTGVRLILSDSDVVWLRDPAPYLRAIEDEHPKLDFAVSTDAQGMLDHRRLGAGEQTGALSREGGEADLDVERWGQCWASMNIGIMLFPPGARRGTLLALQQATTHLSEDDNLRRVDQGPINYRWKTGYRKFKWAHTLFPVRDRTGKRMCGLVDGNVTGAVLPAAQFCNTLTHDVLRLWAHANVRPFALHATWMRRQEEPWKLMRLREQGYWYDSPAWYGLPATRTPPANDASSWMVRDAAKTRHSPDLAALREQEGTVGFLTYDASVLPALLEIERIEDGGIPLHHMRLMHAQLRKLRSALFVARMLNRALILPQTLCSCELGFFVHHVKEGCRAVDHPTLPLPYVCPIDHYLFPRTLMNSPFAHRERTFLDNPRAAHINLSARARVVPCSVGCSDGRANWAAESSQPIPLRRGASEGELVARLGELRAPIIHFEDIEGALGAFSSGEKSTTWHSQAQELLDAYCCVANPVFKKKAGGAVPYLLPPLPNQKDWRGEKRLEWARSELVRIFREAGDTRIAAELDPPR